MAIPTDVSVGEVFGALSKTGLAFYVLSWPELRHVGIALNSSYSSFVNHDFPSKFVGDVSEEKGWHFALLKSIKDMA